MVPRMVSKVSESKSMMFQLSKTVSTAIKWYFDQIYELLNFVRFPFFKNAILWLYSENMSTGYHFGYHRHFFSKISSKICFRKKTWTLSRNIYFSSLDFVFLPILPISTYVIFSFVGQSENILWPWKYFHQKVWHLGFLTHFRTHP